MYRKIFDRYPEPVIVIESGSLIVRYFNEAAKLLFSIDESIKNLRLMDIINTLNIKDIEKLADTILDTGATSDFLLSYKNRDGATWLQTDASLIDRDGKYEFLLTFHPVDTFIKKLNFSRNAMKNIFNSIQTPIYVVEKGSRKILFANNNVKECFGQDMEGKTCWSVFKGGDGPCCEGCLCAIAENEDYSDNLLEKEYYMKKTNKWFHVTLNAVKWINGKQAFLFINMDITRWKKREEQLIFQAHYDDLTDVYSRGFGIRRLEKLMKSNKLHNNILTVCYIDIDNLKEINDTFGHAEGDIVIKLLVSTVKNTIRKQDILVRMGGDEFILGLPYCPLKDAERIISKINKRIGQINLSGDYPYTISFSYGFEEVECHKNCDIEEIIKHADTKMYRQKTEKLR